MLHVIVGALCLIILVPVVVFVASLGGRSGPTPGAMELVFIGLATALVPGVQVLAAILCLRGSRVAGLCLVVFSVPLMAVFFPIGLAVGGYSVWALLRDDTPAPARLPVDP